MARSSFVGVDGCKGGWFSVGLRPATVVVKPKVFPTFCELLAHYSGAKLILVDIPIGLPESEREGVIATARPVKKLGQATRIERLPNADSSDGTTGVARAVRLRGGRSQGV